MKQLLRRMLILVAVFAVAHWNTILFAQYFSGGSEQRAVLKIKSDGSSELTSTVVQPRQAMEGQVRMFERYQKMSEGMGEEGETPKPDAGEGATEPKPFTDVELAQKIRESIKNQSDQLGEDSGEKVNLDVQKDTVRVETIRSFASVEELLKEGYTIWHAGGMMFQNARFEKDTNGLLRVTFTPQANMERYFKNLRAQWKLSGTKTEFKLVFPGPTLQARRIQPVAGSFRFVFGVLLPASGVNMKHLGRFCKIFVDLLSFCDEMPCVWLQLVQPRIGPSSNIWFAKPCINGWANRYRARRLRRIRWW